MRGLTIPAACACKRERAAFTIVELLVVIGTILILVAMLIPALAKSREKAKFGRWEGYMHNQRVQEKMVLQYMFLDEIGSTSIANTAQGIDVEGYNRDKHHGSANNIMWTEGRWFSKHAPRFNGVSSTITSGHLDAVAPEEHAYTAIAWIRPHHVDNRSMILGNEGNGNNGIAIGFDSSGNLESILNGSYITSTLTVKKNTWSMVAIVQNVDGITLHLLTEAGHEQQLLTAQTQDNPSSQRPFLIGSHSSNGLAPYGLAFDGVIDEVVVYSEALPDIELTDAYKMGSP